MIEPVIVRAATGAAAPLVLDSPHSGTVYPADFRPACAPSLLRQAEDAYVDELWGAAPAMGVAIVAAAFPRAYIDPNRSLEDMDPELLDAPWPGPVAPGDKTNRGIGLIWRLVNASHPIYDRKLTVAEVQGRIDRCWRPYHAALDRTLDEAQSRFGTVWHIDCHSMQSRGNRLSVDGPAARRADFVLGDRDGTTCAPAFTRFIAERVAAMGYSVKVNDPYKGVEIVRRHGRPQDGRHSLQIELSRALYMDEESHARGPGFAKLQADLAALTRDILGFIGKQQ
ncbi:MAG: N-formylglutamate amidohydrolase [Alphaproteobacteria bacterium]|nr:N-formylglutamate amidohydrolase [Alphaproteobacteria bacterium]